MRWLKILEKLENFFIKLKEEECELVFFIEDPLFEQKNPGWLKQKTKEYKQMCNVIAQLEKGIEPELLKDLVGQQRVLDLTKEYVYQMLPKYGEVKGPLETDRDLECPRYAFENEAFVVFTENLDFLIYEGEYRLWFINQINFKKMTTKEINKVGLCRELKLTSAQMPIFAMMCGDKIMKQSYLKEFHDDLDPDETKLKSIAYYCREQPDIHNFFTDHAYIKAEFLECQMNYLNCPLATVRECLKSYDLVKKLVLFCLKNIVS